MTFGFHFREWVLNRCRGVRSRTMWKLAVLLAALGVGVSSAQTESSTAIPGGGE